MKAKPISKLMYMGIRRRPRAIVGPWECYAHAVDMAKYAASTQGGFWRVVPRRVTELPTDSKFTQKYTDEGNPVSPTSTHPRSRTHEQR